jgi:hypothetical protein
MLQLPLDSTKTNENPSLQKMKLFFLILFALLFLVAVLSSLSEGFELKSPSYAPIEREPVIPNAPRPPAIGLSERPLS